MRCVVGIDLGSTTTKALLLTEEGEVLGRGITNSRSSYDVACAVAREEALTAARFRLLERHLEDAADLGHRLKEAFRLELYLDQLGRLGEEIGTLLDDPLQREWRGVLAPAVEEILGRTEAEAPELFAAGSGGSSAKERKSDFFRDLAGAAYVEGAEDVATRGEAPFERLLALYDRAILAVETRLETRDFPGLLRRAAARLRRGAAGALRMDRRLSAAVDAVASEPIEELAFAGTGYGRQTLPFPKETVRSEILCHGRGAHRLFPGTRTVLDIGGQDTKAIQVDATGVVTSFQMNDRCAAGSGRYLGYLADELSLGLHELGPLALRATRKGRVSATCTVFAGAELRERLALGETREDVLAGLHRAMMLRALSLLARSGGISNELTFTGGVAKNPMAVQVLGELVADNYGGGVRTNIHPDSIYT
ncbi:MAG TPA: BadF/BadG/BcrA/BcrD ATPase family protein, partial [Thermoanaerobaculia bacterium]|nr:BadF/BadG/BcrA/BcrD ATPase family protein [Thermoanaerobaculia bacterium]